jgi:hypothetical protein
MIEIKPEMPFASVPRKSHDPLKKDWKLNLTGLYSTIEKNKRCVGTDWTNTGTYSTISTAADTLYGERKVLAYTKLSINLFIYEPLRRK